MVLNLSLLITHHLWQTNLSCPTQRTPLVGSEVPVWSVWPASCSRLMKSFYRKTACLHEKIRLHTCSKIPITCQELKREPPFERGCRGKTLICDRLFASVDRAKRSISASSRTSIYPITINYHTLESIKLSRVTYNNFQHIGHAWGEPMALVLPTCVAWGRRSSR